MPGTLRGESSVDGSWHDAKASADGMASGDASATCKAVQSTPGTFGQPCQSSGQTVGGRLLFSGSAALDFVVDGRSRDFDAAGEDK